jgi:hypothetical protein
MVVTTDGIMLNNYSQVDRQNGEKINKNNNARDGDSVM